MDISASCPLAKELAERIRRERAELSQRWLERIAARVTIEPSRVFPSDQLLDHIPLLVEGIADYIENPADEISADVQVIAKAMELGELRLLQAFDAHEILKEYEILGGVLFTFAVHEVQNLDADCSEREILTFSHRLFRAIAIIEQVTTSQYLSALNERVNKREEQLRGFNRLVSHELKNKLGAVLGAAELIREEWVSEAERGKFSNIVLENARALQQVLENLTELTRLDTDSRRQRNVLLREAVAEVLRQQRELIRSRGVTVEVEAEMPRVEVNAAVVELCLSNYLSNAVKYSSPHVAGSWVRVRASLEEGQRAGDALLVVRVIDNGIGVPEDLRGKLFERFFRADTSAGALEGTGLGLSLVKEAVEAIGGRAWADFKDETTAFAFAVPCRRSEDTISADRTFGAARESAGAL